RASHSIADFLDRAADGTQRASGRCARGNHLENLVLDEGKLIVALALRDVGNAHADELAISARQSAEPHLAGKLPAVRILVQPLEGRVPAVQRPVDQAAA